MILFTCLLSCIVLVLYSWVNLIWDSKKIRIPGPLPFPIIGNGHLFLGDSTRFLNALQKLIKQYGGCILVYILSNRYILISDPKYAEALTSSNVLIVKGRSYNFLRPWLGQGLLTSNGNRWKLHRKFLTPAFHFNILQNFLAVFLKNEKILINKLRKMADGNDIELFSIIALSALDNVTESIMGVPINAQTDSESEYVKAIGEISVIICQRMRNAFEQEDALFNLTSSKSVQDKALKVLHGFSKNVIETRKRELEMQNITGVNYDHDQGIKNKHAFLDLLLLAEPDGKKMDAESVREEVDTFMFEGHDTTTSGIVFCLYCISKFSMVQERILEEQKSIFGDNLNRDPTYSEILEMKYLEMVIKESLRLYPSVPLIERMMTEDTNLGGVFVPKNTAVLLNIFHMQRDPNTFDNPLEFEPERFASTLKNTFSWLPFSAGPRNCIGQKFAMLEMKVSISAIVRQFKLLPSDMEVVLGADLILRSKTGVHICIKPR